VVSEAAAVDEFIAARRYRRSGRVVDTMLVRGEGPHGAAAEEQWIQRWLGLLRDGSEAEKVGARRGLARAFERRGQVAEAIELLERNLEAGERGAETLRWLSRLYQAQDDELRSLGAAVEASRDHAVPAGPEPIGASLLPAQPRWPRAARQATHYLGLIGLGTVLGLAGWILAPLVKLVGIWFG